jgi:6-phosphofructokinase 1
VAEGATPEGGGNITLENKTDAFGHARLGGIGSWLAEQIRGRTGWDARSVALGHPQRGGPPSPVDRIMGHLFGSAAVQAAQRGAWGQMVSARGIAPACEIKLVPLAEATKGLNLVDIKRHYDLERYQVTRNTLEG